MKKSLVILVILVGSLALAGSLLASAVEDWGCYSVPSCKPVCKDQVLCKGKAAGVEKMCGPCAPTIKWAGRWLTVLKCPDGSAAPEKVFAKSKRMKKDKMK